MTVRTDFTIDWSSSPRIITIASPSIALNMQDLVDTCRNLEGTLDTLDNNHLLNASGKEDLGSDIYVGITVSLQNAKIAFEARSGPDYIQCEISGGNLVAVDHLNVSMSPIEPTAFTQIVKTSSASATLQELSSIQYSSFNDRITIDIIDGCDCTTFPAGTGESPTNSIANALIISAERGIDNFYIIGDITLTSGDNLDGYELIGQSISKTKITIESDASVVGTEFVNCTITGTLDGNNTIHHCAIETLNYVEGHIHNCILMGYTITLGGSNDCHFLSCYSGDSSDAPIIDCGASGRGLSIRDYSGGIKLINKSGSESICIDLVAGRIELDSTITNGTINVRGIGVLTDDSTGTAIISHDGFINKQIISEAVWDSNAALTRNRFLALK